jgi:hypothetical protein
LVFRSLFARQAGCERNEQLMQPGVEYIVILNDPRLRDAVIHQRECEAHSAQATVRSSKGVVVRSRLMHSLAALRNALLRFSPSRPEVTA